MEEEKKQLLAMIEDWRREADNRRTVGAHLAFSFAYGIVFSSRA